MLTELQIKNFRAFKELSAKGLTRVNLFVGGNNSGKTTLLEAAEILLSEERVLVLYKTAERRGEISLDQDEQRMDVAHLFHGHNLEIGSFFKIYGNNGRDKYVNCKVQLVDDNDGFDPTHSEEEESNLEIEITSEEEKYRETRRLSRSGGITYGHSKTRLARFEKNSEPRFFSIGTGVTETKKLASLWDSIVLTPEENKVIKSLQVIEPEIERLAFVASGQSRPTSILVKLSGYDRPLPLGSMGDGMKRLLSLTLHLIRAENGFLAVDEIDTGLHHTVMVDMWRLVIETARRLNIQVFATTHSLDCLRSLAWLCEQEPGLADQVSAHRVERDSNVTTRYSAEELMIVEQQRMEIR